MQEIVTTWLSAAISSRDTASGHGRRWPRHRDPRRRMHGPEVVLGDHGPRRPCCPAPQPWRARRATGRRAVGLIIQETQVERGCSILVTNRRQRDAGAGTADGRRGHGAGHERAGSCWGLVRPPSQPPLDPELGRGQEEPSGGPQHCGTGSHQPPLYPSPRMGSRAHLATFPVPPQVVGEAEAGWCPWTSALKRGCSLSARGPKDVAEVGPQGSATPRH